MRRQTLLDTAKFAKWGENFETVELPHTWNNLDGQDGGNDYWRGIGTYEFILPNPTTGKKQYIEFQGANHVATVYVNGRELGTHRGGFSTFRYDITPAMRETGNILQVVVTNAVSAVYPQTADFTFYGGIYRDVNFIEVNEAHFDLLKDGTTGVFVTPHCSGKTRLDLFTVNADGTTIVVELKDAEGNVVGAAGADAKEHTDVIIDISNPHLWNGMEDPYCYTAIAKIVKDDVILDEIEVTYGYRSFRVDANTGFWLNGKNVPLHGVSRHQDRLDKGWAISKEDHVQDIELIKEIGANTIRLAHYQHDQYFYDLCDHSGFALWAEIPFGLSEYGVENIVKWHSATPMNHDYTEEYANYYHHEMLKTFATRPYLWATHVWNMFDFAADARDEGGVKGRNNKGLVTYDRTLKKDAFYIYKAYWTTDPFVYVAGRRFADRAPVERDVTVYTNCDKVTLVVNGAEIETKTVIDHAVVFENVALKDGENIVTAKFGDVEDTITLNGVAEHNQEYTLPNIAEAMAAGNWFDDIVDDDDSEEIEVIDGYYSLEDVNGILFANEDCLKVVKGWLMTLGNLTVASMLTNFRALFPKDKFTETLKSTGSVVEQKELAKLNRQLNKIKK